MKQLLLAIGPIVIGGAFWVGAALWPDLAGKDFLRSLCGLFAVVWAILMLAMPKLSELTAVEGLSVDERERLVENIAAARRKIWQLGSLSLFCVVALLFLAAVATNEGERLVAAFAGLVVGYGFVFLYRAKSWHDELHAFIAEINQRRFAAKAREENLKQLSGL